MSFHLSVQSAPERRGVMTAPMDWAGAGGGNAQPHLWGAYTGDEIRVYTLTADTTGTQPRSRARGSAADGLLACVGTPASPHPATGRSGVESPII